MSVRTIRMNEQDAEPVRRLARFEGVTIEAFSTGRHDKFSAKAESRSTTPRKAAWGADCRRTLHIFSCLP